jgi:hypothetical protein
VLVPVYTGDVLSVIPLAMAAVALLLFTLFAPGWQARRTEDVGAPDPAAPPPASPPPPPPPAPVPSSRR